MNSPAPKESRNDMVIFTCKDRFDDMMTCIYEAWASHLGHNNIKLRTEPLGTMELFCEYRHVEADREKTESVIRTIQQKISFPIKIPRSINKRISSGITILGCVSLI